MIKFFFEKLLVRTCFCTKKGSPDRAKIRETIVERLNKVDQPTFTIKERRAVRDWWNLLQAKFKRKQQEELAASGIDCELSEKDALLEDLCEKEESFSAKEKKKVAGKEAAEKIRTKAMERMASKRKSPESVASGAKKSQRCGGDTVEFLKEKAETELSIRQHELELQKKEQEARVRQQELQIELLRQQAAQQVQISQALMQMMQSMANK